MPEDMGGGGNLGVVDAELRAFFGRVAGRRSRYSDAGAAFVAALRDNDWARLDPYVSVGGRVVVLRTGLTDDLHPSVREVLRGRAALRAWLERASLRRIEIGNVMTCEASCCDLVRYRGNTGDVPVYLDRVCFGPGPVVTSMDWTN